MDRRMQKTRAAIYNAMSGLLSRESYDKITIQQIIDAANIGRSTFYAHFETKDELLKSMLQEVFDHIFDNNLRAEATHDFSKAETPPHRTQYQTLMIHFLYHLKEDTGNLSLLLRSKNNEIIWNYLRMEIAEFSHHYLLQQLPDQCQKTLPQDLLLAQLTDSFIGLIKWWIHNDLQQSPETLAAFFTILLTHNP